MTKDEAKAKTDAAVAAYNDSVDQCANEVSEWMFQRMEPLIQDRKYEIHLLMKDIVRHELNRPLADSTFIIEVINKTLLKLKSDPYNYTVTKDNSSGDLTVSWK